MDKTNTLVESTDWQMGISVGISILLGLIIPHYQAITACISVMLCTQKTPAISLKAGITRLIITVAGGLTGILVVLLDNRLQNQWVFMAVSAIGIVATLVICRILKVPPISGRIGCVTFILVILTRAGSDRLSYALFRFISTIYGALVVLIVTWLFSFTKKKLRPATVSQ